MFNSFFDPESESVQSAHIDLYATDEDDFDGVEVTNAPEQVED